MVEEQKTEVVAEKKSDRYKTYALWFFGLLAVGLLIYQVKYSKTTTLNIKGEHIIIGIFVILIAYYIINKNKQPNTLPTKDIVAMECASWYLENGKGLIDPFDCEVEPISDSSALVYFPNSERVYTYEAGKGVIGERFQDITESIIDRERSQILSSAATEKRREDRIKRELAKRGYEE